MSYRGVPGEWVVSGGDGSLRGNVGGKDDRPRSRRPRRRLASLLGALLVATSLILVIPMRPSPAAAADGDHPPRFYAYRDNASNRFWRDVEEILGPRLGYSVQHGNYEPSVTVEVGAVGLSAADRRRLEAAAPGPWMPLKMFATKYSDGALREFGDRAREALREARLGGLWSGSSIGMEPDSVKIGIVDYYPWADEILRAELPDDAFEIEVRERLQPFAGPAVPPGDGQRVAAFLVAMLASATGAVALLRARRIPRARASGAGSR